MVEVRERPLVPEGAEQFALVVERVDYTDGIKVYLKGHTQPFKGTPTESAVGAVNIIKRMMRLKPFEAMWLAIEPHILKEEFRQPINKELCKMFPNKLGIMIAHVLEYDSAYRFFIMDLFSETSAEKLLQAPSKEMPRLIKICKRRLSDNPVARKKMVQFCYLFWLLLYFPKVRKAFRACDFSKLQLDTADRYWVNLRTDYHPGA